MAHERGQTDDRGQELARRLDRPMSVLGLIFLLVILAEPLAEGRGLSAFLNVTSWLLWTAFVAEFVVRLKLAKDRRQFLRSNWWQIPLLAVPFLRFLRLLQLVRVGAVGRFLFAVVRGTNPAARLLSARLAWLAALTLLMVLTASHILHLTHAYDSYAEALHDAAFTTISGQPLQARNTTAQVLELVLAAYSVIIFAALAGSLGAFFLGERDKPRRERR